MSSLLPLGESHADQTNRLRRHHAAEAAQGALTMLRAHCLPANADTDQVHGPLDIRVTLDGRGCWRVLDPQPDQFGRIALREHPWPVHWMRQVCPSRVAPYVAKAWS